MSNTQSLNLIVTGGCGFIGSAFVRQAVGLGHRVVTLDALTYAGHRENLDGVEGSGTNELVVGDICDGRLVAKLLAENAIDGIVHFAAESHVDRSIDTPSAFIETNIRGTFTLLDASLNYWKRLTGEKKKNFRFLNVSTDEVYGSLGLTGKFSETSLIQPNSPYSASKAGADHLVRAWYHTYGLPTLTTHCSNNYGPRQYPEKLIPHMLYCALAERSLPVYGDGGNIRDWIHVDDHCRGIMLVLEKGRPESTYCLGGNAEKTNLELVRTLCRTLDQLKPRGNGQSYESLITFVKDRLGHDRRYAIDDSLAIQELGYRKHFRFEEGLQQTIQWYLNNSAWYRAVTHGSVSL